jgi:cyanate permease
MFGMYNSFFSPIFADLFGTKNLGKVQGLNTFFLLLAVGVGPAAFGSSFDLVQSYTLPITVTAMWTFICCISLFLVKLPDKEAA